MQNEEFVQEFIEEASGHVEHVEALLLKKEETRSNPDSINEIFRAVHSIKGTAGFFALKNIVRLAHAMENVFGEVRNGNITLDDTAADAMLAANDQLKDMVADVSGSDAVDISDSIRAMENLLGKNGAPADKKQAGEQPDEKKQPDEKAHPEEKTPAEANQPEKSTGEITKESREILEDARRHGHRLYDIRLQLFADLQHYEGGPLQLFKKIESSGILVDTETDFGSVCSPDDVLEVADGKKDVGLHILATSILEEDLYREALGLPETLIHCIPYPSELAEEEASADVSRHNAGLSRPAADTAKKKSTPGDEKHFKAEDSVRVHVSVLNDLLNMASEMVLARNQLLRTLEDRKKGIPGLESILQNIDRLTSGMQGKIMQTRMQPVSNVFNKFPRIIRDLSKTLGKEIELQLEGNEVEMDKSVIEALTDPLTHLVRNSADHGLEAPDVREKLGKRRTGTIQLKAFHKGGYVNIEVIDDGAGMDAQQIAAKAEEKGLLTHEEILQMNERELLGLIFRPGFSTNEKVTDISGRGVGMDVVKTNIEKLGGSVELSTVVGKGTTVRLVLPLTLAIIQSLTVESCGQKFALPQVNLKEIVRLKKDDENARIETLHDSEVFRLRDKLLPVKHLEDILKLKGLAQPNAEEAGPQEESDVTRILILQAGVKNFGLVVDRVYSSEETLVKSVPVYLKNCQCYSGVTIMGDGKTAMILDTEGLIRLSGLTFDEGDKERQEETTAVVPQEKQNLLMFKCTGNETFGIDLSMILRVEKIAFADIEHIGEKEFIKFRGGSLRVIHPEQYLAVNRAEPSSEYGYVLVPKGMEHPIGLIVERIIDNLSLTLRLNSRDYTDPGLFGTCIIDDRLVLLVNLYGLFEAADPENYAIKRPPEADAGPVVLAEDTPFFRRMAQTYLEQVGFSVLEAENGEEALQLVSRNKTAAVVSGIEMPVMDGPELAQKVRNDSDVKDLPLIALCADHNAQRIYELSGGSFDDVVARTDRNALIASVCAAIHKRGQRREHSEDSELQAG